MPDSLSALDKLSRAMAQSSSLLDGPWTVNVSPVAGGAPGPDTRSFSVWDKLTRALVPTGVSLDGPYVLSVTGLGSLVGGPANAESITINATTGVMTMVIPAATSGAWIIQDTLGNAFWTTDTRTNITGVKAHLLSAPNPTIASAAGATYSMVANGAQTVNFTGNTQVTALSGVGFFIGQTTIASDTATLTVVTASTLWINGAPLAGANTAITNANALQVNNGFSVFGGNVSVGGAAIADNGIYIRGTPFGTANYNRGIYNTPTFPSTGTTGAVLYEGFHTLTNGATYAGVLGYGCGAVTQGTAVITKFAGHGVDQQAGITVTNNFRCYDCNSQTVATTGGGGNVDMFYILSLITTGSNNRTAGLFIGSVSAVGASNAYGISIGNVTGATTGNFAIQTGTGLVSLGDNVQMTALVTKYNNITTVGVGLAALYGLDNRTALTGVDGAPITLYTPASANQLVRITADIFATAFTSGTATYTITWTENSVARTMVVTATALNTLGTATDLIRPDNATNVTAQLTGVFTATITVAGVVERLA